MSQVANLVLQENQISYHSISVNFYLEQDVWEELISFIAASRKNRETSGCMSVSQGTM